VDDAVLLVRLDTGQVEEEFALLASHDEDLVARLSECADELAPWAEEAGVRLERSLPGALPGVTVAPRFLATIVRHLVANGVKFARPDAEGGPRVAISAEARPGEVVVRVEDNGAGIRSEEIERVFEPLVQVDRLQREQQGMGLGLAIVRGLVALHGGRVWAESGEGVGTTVSFTLPTGPRPSERAAPGGGALG
jgi:signal transduction histidine kinase